MKARKFLAYLLVAGCFAVVTLFVLFCADVREDPWLEADIRTWQSAYPALAELPDFDRLSAQPDGSFLLHKYGEPDQSAVLPEAIAEMLRERDVLHLRKSGDDVFFTTGGAVDDEWGYVITGDDSVCMEGLWQLDKVGGSVYKFSTMK